MRIRKEDIENGQAKSVTMSFRVRPEEREFLKVNNINASELIRKLLQGFIKSWKRSNK